MLNKDKQLLVQSNFEALSEDVILVHGSEFGKWAIQHQLLSSHVGTVRIRRSSERMFEEGKHDYS